MHVYDPSRPNLIPPSDKFSVLCSFKAPTSSLKCLPGLNLRVFSPHCYGLPKSYSIRFGLFLFFPLFWSAKSFPMEMACLVVPRGNVSLSVLYYHQPFGSRNTASCSRPFDPSPLLLTECPCSSRAPRGVCPLQPFLFRAFPHLLLQCLPVDWFLPTKILECLTVLF